MARLRFGFSLAKSRRFVSSLIVLLPLVLALVLICASAAPALTDPALASRAQPTFAAGGGHFLAVKADGSLWAWGENNCGQLGDGTTIDRTSPVRVGGDKDWIAVAAGGGHSLGMMPTRIGSGHSLALKADGSLWAWGKNDFGQLGDGTTVNRPSPVRIGTGNDWAAVAAGYAHTLAIRSEGSLWAWGKNDHGQLGNATTTDASVPVRIGSDSGWVAVSAGAVHSVGLRADGSLWVWGQNSFGQLGDAVNEDRLAPIRVGTTDSWAAAKAGLGHTVVLRADGSLRAMGAWKREVLASGGGYMIQSRLYVYGIGNAKDWTAIAAGDWHSLALKSDGSLWAWGDNGRDQLGDGTMVTPVTEPQRVGQGLDWVAIDAGGDCSLALTSDGRLFAWGRNDQGQLGDGTTSDRSTPVLVLTQVKSPASAGVTTTTTTAPATTTTTAPPVSSVFPDVPASHPYHAAISTMASQGIIGGYTDGTFGPDKLVLRKHFAKMIVGAMGITVTENDWQDANPPFTDCGADDPAGLYSHDYIAAAKANNLTSGKTASTFAPEANITRAQMATMVVRAAQNSGINLDPPGADYSGAFKDSADPTHGANVHLADANDLLAGLQVSGDPAVWMAGNATRGEVAQILWNLMQERP